MRSENVQTLIKMKKKHCSTDSNSTENLQKWLLKFLYIFSA